MEFKNRLIELRKAKGLTQQELADEIFVSRSAVAKWENGNGIPDRGNLESLCTFFGVNADELLSQEDRDVFRTRVQNKYLSVSIMIFSLVFMLVMTQPMTFHRLRGYTYPAVLMPPVVAFRFAGFFGAFAMLYFAAVFVFSLLSVAVPKIRFSRANNSKILLALLIAALLIFILVLLYASYIAMVKWHYNWFFIPQYPQ